MIINIFSSGDGEWLGKASMVGDSLQLEGPSASHIHETLSKIQNKKGLTDQEVFDQLPKIFRSLMMAIPDGEEEAYGFKVPGKETQ